MTSWIKARAFLENCPRFYFWDQELGASSRSHFPDLARMMAKGRIIRTAGVNRAVQAWHRAVFETPATLLRQLVDEKHWKPDEAKRRLHRVGYFDEGPHAEEHIRIIRERTALEGLRLGIRAPCRASSVKSSTRCSNAPVFLALNIGKSPLWGEGGPMTPQEAMACGTVPICFDMNGPWEFIQQDYNGMITAGNQARADGRGAGSALSCPRVPRGNEPQMHRHHRIQPYHGVTLAGRSRHFWICPKRHENALACRPSAGQRTRASRQLQWLYCRFRKARGIGCANPLRPGV